MRIIVGRAPRAASDLDIATLKEAGEKAANAVGGVFVLIPDGASLEELSGPKPEKTRARRPYCLPE